MFKKIFYLFIITIIFSSCLKQEEQKQEEKKELIKPSIINTWSNVNNVIITKEEKIQQLKKRINFKSIITQWDLYNIQNMKELALKNYLDVYWKLQNDHILEKKIASIYFDLKDFKNAYNYYLKIPINEINNEETKKMLFSLMYTNNEYTKEDLKNLNISNENKDYYSLVYDCYSGITNCVNTIKSYSGSYEKINKIKKSVLNFEKTQQWADQNSKYALIAGFFLENKDFLASALIWEEILTKRPDYKIVIKITWYSYYELWDYKKANKYLEKYYNFDYKDTKIAYLLWIINFNLEDPIMSNLYLNNAVLNWYTPKTEIERRLLYNYYVLWDKKNMIKIFRYLLDEEDVNEDDYNIAIFTAMEENELSKAMLWSNKWIQKFNNSSILYALRWWVYRIRNEEFNSINDLNKALDLNIQNPIAILNLWIWFFEKKDYNMARRHFEEVIMIDEWWVFWKEAELQLIKLELQEKSQEIIDLNLNQSK